jgi:hypothetical protein
MTTMNPEFQLNTLVLIYAGQLAAAENYTKLLGLGFRRDQIVKLQKLLFMDVTDLATVASGTVVEARVDPEALDLLLEIVNRRRREREKIDDLIRAGATQRLMEDLFGMDANLFSQHRDKLGIKGVGVGRCPDPDEETSARVWTLWQSTADLGDEGTRFLIVHEHTDLSVRLIERVVRSSEIHGAGLAANAGQQAPVPAYSHTGVSKRVRHDG